MKFRNFWLWGSSFSFILEGVSQILGSAKINNVDKRAKMMHYRVKKRANNRMSVVVKDLGLGINNTPNKSEKKMLKRTLKGMNHAEQGNTATADVRAVTDDGDELILSSPLMIDSQDVLERLIILHDDDE